MRNLTGRFPYVPGVAGRLLTAAAIVILAATDAAADGNSLIGYPQTNIIGQNMFHLDVDTVGHKANTNAFSGMGITWGLGNWLVSPKKETDGFLGRAEVGMDYLLSAGPTVPDVPSQDRFFFNFKLQAYNNPKTQARLVLGGYNLGVGSIAAPCELYVLASGVNSWGKFQAGITHAFGEEAGLKTPAGHADRTYLQGTFNRKLVGRLFGAFSGYTGMSTQSRTSVAMAYYLDNTYKGSFALGYLHYNDASVLPGRHQVYFGFDYDWGGGTK